MKKGPVIVRKYGNRRLYDTSTSRYINLDGLAALVRKGKEVRVVDARTGADLTHATLMQIIAEDAREQPGGLPLELLRQLIVATDHVGRDFVAWYLKSALSAYQKVQGALHGGLTEMGSAALSPLGMMKGFLQDSGAQRPATGELDRLRRRVTELESVVRRKKPAKRRRRAGGSPG